MKQLLLHPLVFTLLFGVALLYLIIGFQLLSRHKRWAEIVEMIFLVLSMLIIGGMSISFLRFIGRFSPEALYAPEITLPYLLMPLGFYIPFLILLFPRFYYTFQNLRYVLMILIKKNPAFCIYNLMLIMSFLVSNTPEHTLKASLIFSIITFFLVYIGKQYDTIKLFNFLNYYHVVVLFLSLAIGNKTIPWTGIYIHKNDFGATMALAFSLMYLQSVRMPKYKGLFLSLAALAFFCVLQSQGGLARVLLVVLISLSGFLNFIRRLPPRVAFASMGIFLAIGISLTILITENAEYIIVEKLGKDMTLTGRTYIWTKVVKSINKRPLFGYGHEGFWQFWRGWDNPALAIRITEVGSGDMIPEHSHCGYLDVGLNLGWLGLAMFLLSLVTAIYYGILHLTRSQGSEGLFPLVILTWIIMKNTTDGGISDISIGWILYVLITVRLTMNTLENFSYHPQFQKPLALEATFPFARTSIRDKE